MKLTARLCLTQTGRASAPKLPSVFPNIKKDPHNKLETEGKCHMLPHRFWEKQKDYKLNE